jgi:hypothetical protein
MIQGESLNIHSSETKKGVRESDSDVDSDQENDLGL